MTEPAEKKKISPAAKVGFAIFVLLAAGLSVYLGIRLAGGGAIFSQGARFEDLPEELQNRIRGLAAAVKQNPHDLAVHSRFCHALLEGQLLRDAEDCYKEILAVDKASADAYTHLGEVAFNKGDYDQARAYYERAVAIDPQYPHVYFNLGWLYMKGTKDYRLARENLLKYLELSPKSPVKYQVSYLILQLNDLIGDRPGVPKTGRELVINPHDIAKILKQ